MCITHKVANTLPLEGVLQHYLLFLISTTFLIFPSLLHNFKKKTTDSNKSNDEAKNTESESINISRVY